MDYRLRIVLGAVAALALGVRLAQSLLDLAVDREVLVAREDGERRAQVRDGRLHILLARAAPAHHEGARQASAQVGRANGLLAERVERLREVLDRALDVRRAPTLGA